MVCSRAFNISDSRRIFYGNLRRMLSWNGVLSAGANGLEFGNGEYCLFEEMRKWKLNDNRYISGRDEGDSFEAYQSQPLEASAKKYASSETEALIHFIAVYGDE